MARIAGVDIPNEKRIVISLTYIYGIGDTTAEKICKDAGVEVQDFSGYLTNEGRSVTLQKLMEYTSGPVEIMLDAKAQDFANGEQALMAFPGKYTVRRIYASKDRVGVEIARRTVILNDTNEDWVKDTERETGNEISFF